METKAVSLQKSPKQLYLKLEEECPIAVKLIHYVYENSLTVYDIEKGNFPFQNISVWEILDFLSERGAPLSNKDFWEAVRTGEIFS